MREKIKNASKEILPIVLILLLSVLIFIKVLDSSTVATTGLGGVTTNASLQRPIDNATDWINKKDEDGKVVLKNPSAPTLSQLVPANQIDGDYIYITHEDLINIPSLFCSAKGVALPGYGSTVVRSGGKSATVTDQGKETAFLTAADIPSATVFRNLDEWTEFGEEYTTKYEDTTSRTLARFKLAEIRDCTPAEAWVLAEFDKNVPGSTGNGDELKITNVTNIEYTEGISGASTVEIDGETIYRVGETGEEKYVKQDGDKFYYVEVNDEYAPYTYVQYAWWKVKTVGQNAATAGIKDTDLAHEAEDFENYIKEVTGQSDVTQLERNSDGTFKIDYEVSMEPQDTNDVKTRFNNATNKYIVGPFKLHYLRSVTKQGDREKVSFAGISSSILVGTDNDGNELLNSDGSSRLQLGDNYRFVYSNSDDASTNYGHDNARNEFDTDEDYPYPSPDEEFYIEIDYLDDLAFIKNLKFDFQYLTAGGKYEYYTGEFLEINWTQFADVKTQTVSVTPTTGAARMNNMNVAISSRSYTISNANGGTGGTFPVAETRGFGIADPEESDGFGGTWRMDVVRDNCWGDEDYIYVKGHVAKNWTVASKQTISITSVTCSTAESVSTEGVYFTLKFKRDYTKARVDERHTVKVKAYIGVGAGSSGYATTEECNVYADLFYENALLKDTIRVASSNSKVVVNGKKLFVKGYIDGAEVDFDANMIHSETPQTAVYSWWVDSGDCLSVLDEENGIFKIEKPGTCTIGCATGSQYGGTSVEVKTYTVVVPTLCLNTREDKTRAIDIENNNLVRFYNAVGTLSSHVQFGNNTRAFPVTAVVYDEQIGFLPAGNFTDIVESGYEYSDVLFEYTDDNDTISISAGWTPRTSDGSQVEDETGRDDDTSGDTEEEPSSDPDESGDDGENDGNSGNNGNSGNSGNNGSSGSSGSSGDLGNIGNTGTPSSSSVSTEYKYCYYLRATSASIKRGQDQINAVGSHEVIDVDAENGLAATASGVPVEIEMLNIPIDLRTSMSGMVWIDEDEQKDASSGTLGIYDGQDKKAPANSVEVVVYKVKYEVATGKEVDRDFALAWDDNGDEIDFANDQLFIDSNGEYKIPHIQVPAEEGLDGSQYVMSYDVEFIYDGQTYEATEYLVPSSGQDKTTVKEKLDAFKKTADETAGPDKDYTEYAKSSYIVENADERYEFDKKFAEIYGDKVITDDGKTEGKATGAKLNYESEVVSVGSAQKIKSNLITHDANNFVYDQYKLAARTSEAGLLLPYERRYHVEENYYDNYTFQSEQYKPIDEYFHQINLGLLERYHSDIGVKKDLYTANVVVNGNSNVTKYNSLMPLTEEALNLQLKPEYRQHTYKIDLYNSDYMYRSGAYSSITDELTKTVIQAIKEGSELRLFVTYKLEFINESVHTDVSINEFVDYYDKSFTRIDDDLKMQIEDQTALDGEPSRIEKTVAYAPYYRKLKSVGEPTAYNYNKAEDLNESIDDSGNVINTVVNSGGELILDTSSNGFATGSVKFKDEGELGNYKVSSSVSLDGYDNSNFAPNEDLTLEPGEVLEVFVTYEVDREGYNTARGEAVAKDETRKDNLLGEKNNIIEVSNYTTFYTEEACNRHTTTRYTAKHVSGRVDQDSAPDNVDIEKITNSSDTKMLEDDTEFAPCVTVEVREAEPRTLDGVVWEDSRQDYGVSDGIYNDGEKGIEGIDVTMVEKIRVTTEDLDKIKQYAQQKNPNVFNDLKDLGFLSHEFEYIWKSDAFDGFENEITSGADGKYEFKNFVSGTYVVRFEYGNQVNETDLKYNGQDYKNTAYQADKVNPIRNDNNEEIPIDTSDIIHLSGKSTLNNEWHDLSSNDNAKALEEDRVSDARDYEPQRLRTIAYARTITNENAEVLASAIEQTKDVTSEEAIKHVTDEYRDILKANQQEFVDNTRMVANTAKLFIDIEKQDTIAYKKVKTEDGEEIIKVTEAKDNPDEKHEYYVKNIDFGLVERPETRINIRKEISAIQLLKNDGKELILGVKFDENGNLIKDSSQGNGSVRLEKISEINKESLGDGQGFKYIAMEAKMLNGLQVKLTYRIEVINNSELDYTTATLASRKNTEYIYELVNRFENTDEEKLYSEEGLQGTVPFNSGKAIIYGRYLGTYYYTNRYIDDYNQINAVYGAKDIDGTEYNKYESEVVVKTTVDQLVDYIDNDLSIDMNDVNYENSAWVGSSDADREHKLSEISYEKSEDGTYKKVVTTLQDDKQRAYVSKNNGNEGDVVKNNIYMSTNDTMISEPMRITYNVAEVNDDKQPVMTLDSSTGTLIPQVGTRGYDAYTSKENTNVVDNNNGVLTTELVPEKYKETHTDAISTGEIMITTSAQASEEAINNMNYDNLVEVAMYSNSVGRRDMQTIPGNANMIAKDNRAFKAGYIKAYNSATGEYEFKTQTVTYTKDGESITVNTERDAYAARDTVTFSEPTGLSLARQQANKTIRILLASLIIAAIAIVAAIAVTAIRRNKYDDGDILKTRN